MLVSPESEKKNKSSLNEISPDDFSEQEVRNNFRKLQMLYKLGRSIFEIKDESIILKNILEAVKKILSIERAFIATFFENKIIPRVVENINLSDDIAGWPISRTMISRVRKGETILSLDAKNDEEYSNSESVHRLDLRSVLCCPVGNPDLPRGLIYVDNRAKKNVFKKEDAYFLNVLSHYAFLALEYSELVKENQLSKVQEKENRDKLKRESEIVGNSPKMQQLLSNARKIAITDFPVLIVGETGTGKEILANYIHFHSGRESKRFVPINIAAVQKELLHSELFGHEKGAFTGAIENRIGKIEYARGGTFFLDEAQDMPKDIQAVFLRLLEEYEYERLGSNQPEKADIRIITAVSEAPEKLLEEGRLRQDLFFRLNSAVLVIPPLRERVEDIPVLLHHYMKKFSCEKTITEAAMDKLIGHQWPGNVRELIRFVQAANIFISGEHIDMEDLPEEIRYGKNKKRNAEQGHFVSLDKSVSLLQKQKLREALEIAGGKDKDAIRLLGVSRAKYYEMKKHYGFSKGSAQDNL